jgi:glyoxylase-like metal-dependent hydrolase (beta-lactamase superfamily II)
VLAFTSANACVTRLVRDGDIVQCGDRSFRVVHTPGHSSDSICLYCADDHVLFAGDTPLRRSSGASYTEEFVEAIARLSALDIQQIYYGHGAPLLTGANAMIADILRATHTAQGAGAGGA